MPLMHHRTKSPTLTPTSNTCCLAHFLLPAASGQVLREVKLFPPALTKLPIRIDGCWCVYVCVCVRGSAVFKAFKIPLRSFSVPSPFAAMTSFLDLARV